MNRHNQQTPLTVLGFVSPGAGGHASLQSGEREQEETGLRSEHTQEATESTQEAALPLGSIPATHTHTHTHTQGFNYFRITLALVSVSLASIASPFDPSVSDSVSYLQKLPNVHVSTAANQPPHTPIRPFTRAKRPISSLGGVTKVAVEKKMDSTTRLLLTNESAAMSHTPPRTNQLPSRWKAGAERT